MRKLCDDIFFGIYSYLLRVERGSKNEISFYFAYSTLFTLLFLQILILAGVLLLVGGINVEEHKIVSYGVALAFSIFLINWMLFLKKDRYKKTLSQYFKGKVVKQKIAKTRAARFVSFVFLQFMIITAIKIAQFA